ncbi:MAG: ABC transporter ATP-binding protein [Clostridiales bacterium]|nr:ABC transporter ATP-binding protein [Clostridiales bacterium]
MIEIRHLTKKYGSNVAVNDLSITLESGNIYGFLGPNGAGKSTTMNIITGYIGATSGEVLINGYDINREPEKAKQCIGYLPEMPPLYGDMKVIEYLNFVADLKKLNRNTREADLKYVMNLTKISSMRDRLIHNLSKGYKQRVGLAQALMGLPEIIILDEPTVGLDPTQIIEIRELILSLKENHTVVLSSHILQEISAVCDHVFIISNGNLVASDTMEHLEEEMSGAQQLAVTVRATRKEAEMLQQIDGVRSVEILEESSVEEPEEQTVPAREMSETEENHSEGSLLEENKGEAAVTLPEGTAEENSAGEAAEGCEEQSAEDAVGSFAEKEVKEVKEAAAENERSEKQAGNAVPEVHMEITADPGCDLREAVFRYCADTGIVLLEMSVVTRSLEEIFLELTDAKEVR